MLDNNVTLDKINFNTDRLVIAAFPAYAGGKFLINSLALSDGAVMQSQRLAEDQLAGILGPDEKLQYLKDNIKNLDFGTGCIQLFGVDYDDYRRKKDPENWHWTPITRTLTQGDRYFFLVAHNQEWFELFRRVWPRAKILVIKNSSRIVSRRIGNNPFMLTDTFDYYFEKYAHWSWNADWYFDHDDTIRGVAQLYRSMQLPDFNADRVSQFYRAWFNNLNLLP